MKERLPSCEGMALSGDARCFRPFPVGRCDGGWSGKNGSGFEARSKGQDRSERARRGQPHAAAKPALEPTQRLAELRFQWSSGGRARRAESPSGPDRVAAVGTSDRPTLLDAGKHT